MSEKRNQQETAGVPESGPATAPLSAAALAAGMLEELWAQAGERDPVRAEVVRELARGLREELEALAGDALADAPLEGSLRAADVANLAASSLAELPGEAATGSAAAVHLAAGAVRALVVLVGDGAGLEEDRASYLLKDARGAAWRAGLAARQADEFFGAGG